MARNGVEGMDRVEVVTIHESQGSECDYFIVDFLIALTLGFLDDPRRILVLLTRARHGLIFLSSSNMLEAAKAGIKPHRKNFVRDVFQELSQFKRLIQPDKRYPHSVHYTPPRYNESAIMLDARHGSILRTDRDEDSQFPSAEPAYATHDTATEDFAQHHEAMGSNHDDNRPAIVPAADWGGTIGESSGPGGGDWTAGQPFKAPVTAASTATILILSECVATTVDKFK